MKWKRVRLRGGPMSWFGKNAASEKTNPSSYSERVYREALCTRKHCTEACDGKSDVYKFWALFLAGDKFDQKILTEKINYLPDKLRLVVYGKFINHYEVINKQAYNQYIASIKYDDYSFYQMDAGEYNEPESTGSSSKSEKSTKTGKDDKSSNKSDEPKKIKAKKKEQISKFVRLQVEKDKKLVLDIFKQCKKSTYKDEESVFNIYKQLSKSHAVDDSILALIFNLLTMPNATPDIVYTIINYCFTDLGFSEIYEVDNDEDSISFVEEKEMKGVRKSESEFPDNLDDSDGGFDSNTLENSITKVRNYSEIFSSIDSNTNLSKADTKSQMIEQLFTNSKIKEMIQAIVKYNFNTLLVIIDVSFTTNLSIKEIVLQACKFSTITSPETLIKVLGARANTRYYKGKETRSVKKTVKRREETYFDFLVIQNETIRAQENMKEQHEMEIAELERKLNKGG